MIIDSHAHIFPVSIAEKAVAGIGDFYGIKMNKSGDVKKLALECKKNRICKSLVTSTATKKQQVRPINLFLKNSQEENPLFFAFGTLSPEMTKKETDEEIEWMIENNLRGIKLHPDFQKTKADDPAMVYIAKRAAGKLPVLIHAGDSRFDYSNPDRIRGLLEKSPPKLCLIAAHLGGYTRWQEALAKLPVYENLYVDSSSSLYFLGKNDAVSIMEGYGYDRVLFGSDFPMWDQGEEIKRIKSLGLDAEKEEKIFYKNAKKLFNLTDA